MPTTKLYRTPCYEWRKIVPLASIMNTYYFQFCTFWNGLPHSLFFSTLSYIYGWLTNFRWSLSRENHRKIVYFWYYCCYISQNQQIYLVLLRPPIEGQVLNFFFITFMIQPVCLLLLHLLCVITLALIWRRTIPINTCMLYRKDLITVTVLKYLLIQKGKSLSM